MAGGPWVKYRDKFNDAFAMETMSSRYGWTPEYIKKLESENNNTYLMYLSILAGESDAEKVKDKK